MGKKVEYANDVCELKTKESGQKVILEYANDVCELKTKETGQKVEYTNDVCEWNMRNVYFYPVSLFSTDYANSFCALYLCIYAKCNVRIIFAP